MSRRFKQSEESKPPGGKITIRRDVIERGGSHEVRSGLPADLRRPKPTTVGEGRSGCMRLPAFAKAMAGNLRFREGWSRRLESNRATVAGSALKPASRLLQGGQPPCTIPTKGGTPPSHPPGRWLYQI